MKLIYHKHYYIIYSRICVLVWGGWQDQRQITKNIKYNISNIISNKIQVGNN